MYNFLVEWLGRHLKQTPLLEECATCGAVVKGNHLYKNECVRCIAYHIVMNPAYVIDEQQAEWIRQRVMDSDLEAING